MPPDRRMHRRAQDSVPYDPEAESIFVCRACGATPSSAAGATSHCKACFLLFCLPADWEGRFPKPWVRAGNQEYANILRQVAGEHAYVTYIMHQFNHLTHLQHGENRVADPLDDYPLGDDPLKKLTMMGMPVLRWRLCSSTPLSTDRLPTLLFKRHLRCDILFHLVLVLMIGLHTFGVRRVCSRIGACHCCFAMIIFLLVGFELSTFGALLEWLLLHQTKSNRAATLALPVVCSQYFA
jgi:hypothetical protein